MTPILILGFTAALYWAASRCPLGRAIALGFDQMARHREIESPAG